MNHLLVFYLGGWIKVALLFCFSFWELQFLVQKHMIIPEMINASSLIQSRTISPTRGACKWKECSTRKERSGLTLADGWVLQCSRISLRKIGRKRTWGAAGQQLSAHEPSGCLNGQEIQGDLWHAQQIALPSVLAKWWSLVHGTGETTVQMLSSVWVPHSKETSLFSTTTKKIAVRMKLVFFYQVTSDRMQRHSLKFHKGRFSLGIRKISPQKRWSNIRTGCPGKRWNPRSWRCLKDVWMWQ